MKPLSPDQVVRAAITAEVAGDRDLASDLIEGLDHHELVMFAAYAIGTSAALLTEQAAQSGQAPSDLWASRALAEVTRTA